MCSRTDLREHASIDANGKSEHEGSHMERLTTPIPNLRSRLPATMTIP